jgi:hypothetical protein
MFASALENLDLNVQLVRGSMNSESLKAAFEAFETDGGFWFALPPPRRLFP